MNKKLNNLFKDYNFQKYIKKNNIVDLFSFEEHTLITEEKLKKNAYNRVDTDFADLARLHYLITSRKVTTVLEFGVGKSTRVLADALRLNKAQHNDFVIKKLRRFNPFELHSVDNLKMWIDSCDKQMPENLKCFVTFHECELFISDFQGKMCSYYHNIPNICPDLIYLDGPNQSPVKGNLRGLSTDHPDRMPMAADILAFEHFLQPGSLIVVDGRAANARFLRCNLQRNWSYLYDEEFDQHFFEMDEKPLGKHNKDYINFVCK